MLFCFSYEQAEAYSSGMYLGAAAGWQYAGFKLLGEVDPGLGDSHTNQSKRSANGFLGNLYLGYIKYFDEDFAMALELNGSMNSTSLSSHYGSTTSTGNKQQSAKQHLTYMAGISLMPMFSLFNDSNQLFFRAGLGVGQWKSDAATGFMGPNGSTNGFKKTDMYFMGGLGWQSQISKHWWARLEGDYVYFNSFSCSETAKDNTASPNPHGQPHSINLHFKPQVFQVTLGVNYRF